MGLNANILVIFKKLDPKSLSFIVKDHSLVSVMSFNERSNLPMSIQKRFTNLFLALNQSLKAGEQFTIAANDIMTPTLLGPYSIEVAVVDQPSDPKNSYEVHACAITVVLP
uniref:Uncharacterized protein n=1 Tax=Rhizophagus irregularis (strain DAOM 181602 / DAOM 197198 / MUCL 43194) TaxID=747089 RepID=U9T5H1_RHIID